MKIDGTENLIGAWLVLMKIQFFVLWYLIALEIQFSTGCVFIDTELIWLLTAKLKFLSGWFVIRTRIL